MKMKYMKPAMTVECFQASQSIAHNCGKNLDFTQATLKYKSTCGWNTRADLNGDNYPDVVFIAESTCNPKIGENDFSGVCYNNPDGGYNVFNS